MDELQPDTVEEVRSWGVRAPARRGRRRSVQRRAWASSGHDHGVVEEVRPWGGKAPARQGRGGPASGGCGRAPATTQAQWRLARTKVLTGRAADAHQVLDIVPGRDYSIPVMPNRSRV